MQEKKKNQIHKAKALKINKMMWETVFYELKANVNIDLKNKFYFTILFSNKVLQKWDSMLA